MRRFFRITFYFGVAALFLGVALLGFTQTRYFRTYLRGIILQSYPQYINGTVQFDRLEGNLITGTTIHNVVVTRDSMEIFSSERIEIKYDPTALLFDRVVVRNLILINPRIRVWRSVDGSWNVSELVKATTDKASPTKILEVRNAEIKNARLSMVDSLTLLARRQGVAPKPSSGTIDYATLELSSLQLSAGARIEPRDLFFAIRKLSFESQKPRFRLARFNGDFNLSPSLASIKNCVIQTTHSSLKLDAQLKNVDVTSIHRLADLEKAPLELTLEAENLDTRELKQLLYPHVDFLDRTFSVEAKAEGTFRTLSVETLNLRTPRSTLHVRGTISNLHAPENIQFELASIDNRLSLADIKDFAPGLTVPDLRFLGEARYNLVFNGKPEDFTVHLKGVTDAGELELDGSMRSENLPTYKATLYLKNADLGIITRDDQLRSQLNARITVDGAGTDLRTMTAIARVEIDSSSISDIPLERSVIVLDANDGAIRTHTTTIFGTAHYDVSGRIQFHKDSTSYALEGRVGSLDLGQLLKDHLYESDFTFELSARGSWLNAERLRSDADVRFVRSSFNKQTFDSAKGRIHYDTRDTDAQSFTLVSDVADLTVDGMFSASTFFANVAAGAEIISKAVNYRMRNLDSLRAFVPFQLPPLPRFQAAAAVRQDSINATFNLTVHDLYPLGVFTHQRLSGRLVASGGVSGGVNNMETRGQIASGSFEFMTPPVDLEAKNTRLKWELEGVSKHTVLQTLRGTVDLNVEQLGFGETSMTNVTLGTEIKGNETKYSFSALVDSTAHVLCSGQLDYRGALYHFNMNELKIGVGSLLYENADPISVAMGKDGFLVKSLQMRHEAEDLSVSGYFNPTGVSDIDVTAKGFLLNNLRQLVNPSKIPESLRGIGGIVSGHLLLRGTFEHPNLSLDATVDGVRVGETVFGQVESRLSFFEHALNVFVSYRYDPQQTSMTPDMLFSGTLPFELPLGKTHNHKPKGLIDLALQSKGVRLDLFSPFIPVVSNLSGFLTCDLKMKGSTDAPEYAGYMSLSSAQFLFKPLNIAYILDGRFVSDKKSIVLQEVMLRNVAQDQNFGRGLMNLSGNFTLEGLKLGDFDLLAKGQLLFMKETARIPGAKFYGDVFASTGPSGIRWSGKLSRSLLSGEVDVRNGKLSLPPERETVFLESKNIAILFHDDTSTSKPDEHSRFERGKRAGPSLALNSPDGSLIGSFERKGKTVEAEAETDDEEDAPGSFLDNIVYDLILEAQGPTQLRLIVNPITNEELFADLKGRLAFEKNGPQARLNGEVEVGNRSYYNYFKRFDATGKLRFAGDALNPELNITGKYEGVHSKLSDSAQVDEKVLVTLEITGTRNEPKLKFDLEVERNGKFEKPTSADTESDAIAFLLSGQFRDELTSTGRQKLIGENLIGLTSGVLSAPLREYIRKETGVSLDVLYYGGASFQQSADVRLSGEIGDAVVRFGGRVLNNINNTNVSVELPMSSILGTESWRNLVLTLERRVEGLENIIEDRTSNGARLLYRINF
ncbi:MAG: hypothetical protein HY562_04395 [Ignavibacteriales bacterium]|nr:hypothetical protein [Ignavibacteriales bacterium]